MGLHRLIAHLTWWLGILCLAAGFLVKVLKPAGIAKFGSITAHGLLFFAAVLFLCALASSTIAASSRF